MTIENFNSIAAEIVKAAPTEKAVAFAEKVIAQIRAKGDEWILANTNNLHTYMSADQCRTSAPVADNRIFFMTKWQIALTK